MGSTLSRVVGVVVTGNDLRGKAVALKGSKSHKPGPELCVVMERTCGWHRLCLFVVALLWW